MDQESAKDKLDHLIQDIKDSLDETQLEEARCMKSQCDKDAVQELDILKKLELKHLNDTRIADVKAHSEGHERRE